MAALGLTDLTVHWLGLPDSALAAHERELTGLLSGLLAEADACVVPWPDDPHPDHRAAGRAALAAAPMHVHRWSYPIWMWHWTAPADPSIPWSRAYAHYLSEDDRARKRCALAAVTSQLRPGPDGQPPILPPEMLAHFARDVEVLFHHPRSDSTPVQRFADLYTAGPDPWSTVDSWYERRKRATVLAALPRRRYPVIVEPGCGNGALTDELAARCARLIAFDPVDRAVAAARSTAGRHPHVDIRVGRLPADLPDAPIDLVVLSEILYYLGDPDLDRTLDRVLSGLRPGGDLVAVHWRSWAPDAPRAAADAHARLLARPELRMLVEHTDEEFLLHVLRRR